MSNEDFVPPAVPTFRMDIGTDSDFTRRGWGKRLRALGGEFSEARGAYSGCRFLTIPATVAGLAFAKDAAMEFGAGAGRQSKDEKIVTVVLHPNGGGNAGRNSPSVVHCIDAREFADGFARALRVFEAGEREWWRCVGRAKRDSDLARAEADRARRIARAADDVAALVNSLLDLGVSEETIRGATDVALLAWSAK